MCTLPPLFDLLHTFTEKQQSSHSTVEISFTEVQKTTSLEKKSCSYCGIRVMRLARHVSFLECVSRDTSRFLSDVSRFSSNTSYVSQDVSFLECFASCSSSNASHFSSDASRFFLFQACLVSRENYFAKKNHIAKLGKRTD